MIGTSQAAAGGSVNVLSGHSASGTSGNIEIATASTMSPNTVGGSASITTGSASGGSSGDISG